MDHDLSSKMSCVPPLHYPLQSRGSAPGMIHGCGALHGTLTAGDENTRCATRPACCRLMSGLRMPSSSACTAFLTFTTKASTSMGAVFSARAQAWLL